MNKHIVTVKEQIRFYRRNQFLSRKNDSKLILRQSVLSAFE